MLEEIDAATVTPSDFTIKLQVKRTGLFGACNDYPLKNTTSAQILAFVDAVMETKIFAEPIQYWTQEFKTSQRLEDLNDEFSDVNQVTKLVYNEESPYDIKSCLAIKKLDNSIYQFKEMAIKAKQLIRERTVVYKKYKLL